MNKEKETPREVKPQNNEIQALKEALNKKNEELKKSQLEKQRIENEREQVRQVLKEEEEKGLLRKYGFASEELENVRLLGKGEITEELLKDLKQKAYQKQTNAFISLLQDSEPYSREKHEPWEKQIKYMKEHPKGKVR